MNIFSKHLKFEPVDPLGDGLREEIQAEQREAAINLSEDHSSDTTTDFWQNLERDIHEDPEWFRFSSDE